MTLANKITLFRIFLIPIILIILAIPPLNNINTIFNLSLSRLLFLILFIVGSLSDLLDGYIARHYNQITDFGKFLDPIADKILVFLGLLFLLMIGKAELWVVTIILLREFLISGVRLVVAAKSVVIAASIWGKLKTTVTMFAVIFILAFSEMGEPFALIGTILLYTATVLTVISGLDYLLKSKSYLSGKIQDSPKN